MLCAVLIYIQNNLTYGIIPANGCSGIIPPIERLGFAGMCLQDAGNGVRNTDFVSSFPSGLHVGASWNRTLAYDRANHMGAEFKKKGVHIALGPVVGPLGRLATGGRDWEGASNDPYLAGVIAGETVKGIQDAGVMTSLKVRVTRHHIAPPNIFSTSSAMSRSSIGIQP
jgi:beta-glucosidase